MPPTISAIETRYNGYRFRSRTEARWAVFFDALNIPYQYELEGFNLPDGTRYLPDFWLPQHEYWIEIKPASNETETSSEKLHQLCTATKKRGFLLCGPPEPPGDEWSPDMCGDRHYLHDQHGWDNHHEWCICGWCGFIDLQYGGRSERINCGCKEQHLPGVYVGRIETHNDSTLLKAYEAARSARFEFDR